MMNVDSRTLAIRTLATATVTAAAFAASTAYRTAANRPVILEKSLPESGRAAASKLLPALEKAATERGVKVRASLFDSELNSLYGYMMDGVPTIMFAIAQAKARACKNGTPLQNPGLVDTLTKFVGPWLLGYTDEMPVMGVAMVELPGVDGINYFVVNGAPEALKDLEIAEECLAACGLGKDADTGIWSLLEK